MTTRREAERGLAKLGLELWPDSGRHGNCWHATIDAVGRTSIDTDCRGQAIHDYTASASEFWAMVLQEGRDIAGTLSPCPLPPGE